MTGMLSNIAKGLIFLLALGITMYFIEKNKTGLLIVLHSIFQTQHLLQNKQINQMMGKVSKMYQVFTQLPIRTLKNTQTRNAKVTQMV